MSFGPTSLLVPRFKSFDPPQADLGLKLGSVAILNQNPIFEMGSQSEIPQDKNFTG